MHPMPYDMNRSIGILVSVSEFFQPINGTKGMHLLGPPYHPIGFKCLWSLDPHLVLRMFQNHPRNNSKCDENST